MSTLNPVTTIANKFLLPGDVTYPYALAINSHKQLFISDIDKHSVSVYDYCVDDDTNKFKYIFSLGQFGSSRLEFNRPLGLVCDSHDSLFVCDCFNNRVQIFNRLKNGMYKYFNAFGGGTTFKWPDGIAVDSSDNVYVRDIEQISMFSREGKHLRNLCRSMVGCRMAAYSDNLYMYGSCGKPAIYIHNLVDDNLPLESLALCKIRYHNVLGLTISADDNEVKPRVIVSDVDEKKKTSQVFVISGDDGSLIASYKYDGIANGILLVGQNLLSVADWNSQSVYVVSLGDIEPPLMPINRAVTKSVTESLDCVDHSVSLRIEREAPVSGVGETRHCREGTCVIINNVKFHPETKLRERKGSVEDAEQLKKMFMSLGMKVESFPSPAMPMRRILKRYRDAETCGDIFIVCVLTHGAPGGTLYGSGPGDGHTSLTDIINLFTSASCPALAGKLKLFLIQACQAAAAHSDHGVDGGGDSSSDSPVVELPDDDMILVYPVQDEYRTWKDNINDGWMIHTLCSQLELAGSNAVSGRSLSDVLSSVNGLRHTCQRAGVTQYIRVLISTSLRNTDIHLTTAG